jgi:chloramphenicol-sensitive protein RarD
MSENNDTLPGFGFALGAYLLWGLLPIYMKALAHISPAEVLAHRVIWSLPIAGAVLWATRRTHELKLAFRSPKTLAMVALTAALITVNWGTYVWAIGAGHALDAALGYYINPLFSVLLGAVLLGERLSPAQILAIGLAATAVVILTVALGSVPIAAAAITLSWGFYAYLKRALPIGPNQGFFLEIALLTMPAVAYFVYLVASGRSHFLAGVPADSWLLFGCGAVTAVPLMLYVNGAKLLRLSTIAVLQYLVPTMIFLTAVFLFGEPFGRVRMIAFPMIWTALVIYTVSLVRQARHARFAAAALQGPQVTSPPQ